MPAALDDNDEYIADASCMTCGFGTLHSEVAPENMPLDVYPDPTGRYQEITRNMPRHILLAACRVIGTHIHIGMPDHETALRVYNSVVPHYMELCEKGNGSFGERLAIYRIMAPDYEPKPYRDWDHFAAVVAEKGFGKIRGDAGRSFVSRSTERSSSGCSVPLLSYRGLSVGRSSVILCVGKLRSD